MDCIVKKKIINAIRTVVPIDDYHRDDCIYSRVYNISHVALVYILKQLSLDFNFKITDDFIDSLEMVTFAQLEELLLDYEGKQ